MKQKTTLLELLRMPEISSMLPDFNIFLAAYLARAIQENFAFTTALSLRGFGICATIPSLYHFSLPCAVPCLRFVRYCPRNKKTIPINVVSCLNNGDDHQKRMEEQLHHIDEYISLCGEKDCNHEGLLSETVVTSVMDIGENEIFLLRQRTIRHLHQFKCSKRMLEYADQLTVNFQRDS